MVMQPVKILPFSTHVGFTEDENGYDLIKIEDFFILPCDEIGDDCIARALGAGAFTWIFGVNKDKEPAEAIKTENSVLIALLKGNNLDLKSMLEKDVPIITNIKKELPTELISAEKKQKKLFQS